MKEVTLFAVNRCSVAGCNRRHHAQGKCMAHYRRDLRGSGRTGEILKKEEGRSRLTVRANAFTLAVLRKYSERSNMPVAELARQVLEEWAKKEQPDVLVNDKEPE